MKSQTFDIGKLLHFRRRVVHSIGWVGSQGTHIPRPPDHPRRPPAMLPALLHLAEQRQRDRVQPHPYPRPLTSPQVPRTQVVTNIIEVAEIVSARSFVIIFPRVLWRRLTTPPLGLIRRRSRRPEEVCRIASCLPPSDGILPTENGIPYLGVEQGIRQEEVATAEECEPPHAQQDVVMAGSEAAQGSGREVLSKDDCGEEEEVGVVGGQPEVRGGL